MKKTVEVVVTLDVKYRTKAGLAKAMEHIARHPPSTAVQCWGGPDTTFSIETRKCEVSEAPK